MKKKTSSDVRTSPKAMAKLLKEARRLKLVLSANAEHNARVGIKWIFENVLLTERF